MPQARASPPRQPGAPSSTPCSSSSLLLLLHRPLWLRLLLEPHGGGGGGRSSRSRESPAASGQGGGETPQPRLSGRRTPAPPLPPSPAGVGWRCHRIPAAASAKFLAPRSAAAVHRSPPGRALPPSPRWFRAWSHGHPGARVQLRRGPHPRPTGGTCQRPALLLPN